MRACVYESERGLTAPRPRPARQDGEDLQDALDAAEEYPQVKDTENYQALLELKYRLDDRNGAACRGTS